MLNFEQAKTMVENLMAVEEQTKEAEAVDFLETTFTEQLTKEITSGSYKQAMVDLPSYIEKSRIRRLLDGNGYKDHYSIDSHYIVVRFF